MSNVKPGHVFMRVGKYFSFDVIIFVFLASLLILAGRTRLFRDPGTFFHIAAGEYMLNSGRLIYHDMFSFTKYGEDWVAHQWLGELIMALMHRVGGLDALLVMTVSAVALLYSWLALKIYKSGMNEVLGTLILMIAFAASSHHFHIRPHILSILILAITFGKLCDVEFNRASMKTLFWLMPLFIVWTNIHGGVLGGLLTLTIVAVGWTISGAFYIEGPVKNRRDILLLWLMVASCVGTILINPYGIALPKTWFAILKSSTIREVMQEHASLITLMSHAESSPFSVTAPLLLCGALYGLFLAGLPRQKIRIVYFIPIMWFIMALSSIRHGPLFAVLAVIAMADMFPYLVWVDRAAKRGIVTLTLQDVTPLPIKWPKIQIVLLLIIIGCISIYSASIKSRWDDWQLAKLDAAYWPVEHLPRLKSIEKAVPAGSTIFNDMLFGGFLIYQTPGLRVFIDDRWELYGDEFVLAYLNAGKNEFILWEQKYRFEYALVKSTSRFNTYLDAADNWHVIEKTEDIILYKRKTTASLSKS